METWYVFFNGIFIHLEENEIMEFVGKWMGLSRNVILIRMTQAQKKKKMEQDLTHVFSCIRFYSTEKGK